MIRERLTVIFLATVFPWLFIVFVVPYVGYAVFRSSSIILGPYAQVLGYVAALLAFILFLVIWYMCARWYLLKFVSRGRSVELPQ